MAIIRNERSTRLAQEQPAEVAAEEEEIDYSWHPSEEEFTSPLTADQWAELLGDAAFGETDAARAVRCLRDYGEPATFQQLSIRYRGTMGRYRRWLNEAAQAAGQRYGIPAPQKDQFGMDEWWPLLYRTRATGKPGAGVFEMELRPEVEEAYLQIDEQEKQAKRAENARQLQRIEQLERARREERERRAAEVTKVEERRVVDGLAPDEELTTTYELSAAPQPALAEPIESAPTMSQPINPAPVQTQMPVSAPVQQPASQPVQAPAQMPVQMPVQDGITVPVAQVAVPPVTNASSESQVVSYRQPAAIAQEELLVQPEEIDVQLPAFEDYLVRVRNGENDLPYWDDALEKAPTPDANGPIDYAMRYAERLRAAFLLIHETVPTFSVANAARTLGDESVETLQDVLNGEKIPSFAYLNKLRDNLYINLTRLEVADGYEDTVPTFLSLTEACEGACPPCTLLANPPSSIICVLDGSRKRRTALVFCYGPLQSAVVGRESCGREVTNELERYARECGIGWTSHRVSGDEWDKLVAGRTWPGSLMH